MSVDKVEFRRALGNLAASVTVVTTKFEGGQLGITVTAFSSVSLEPPLVLICIDRRARIHDRLQVGGHFAVNILSETQEYISRRFASSELDQFRDIDCSEGAAGVPLIEGTLAAIECEIVEHLPGGDHTIFVGRVEATHVRPGKPLFYFHGGYATLASNE